MTLWAIVPIKPLGRAKSRLSSVLSREERTTLSRDMMVHLLDVLGEVPGIERTLVVSRDTQALALAREHGARTVAEWGTPDLNPALVRATIVAKQYGVSGVLVLPADLPLISPQDVETLISKADQPPVVVIAPRDPWYEKMYSQIEQAKARGGKVIAVATDGDELIPPVVDHIIWVPETPWMLSPVTTIIPLQLLAYHIAALRGLDIDQPRNLAKSVTVE